MVGGVPLQVSDGGDVLRGRAVSRIWRPMCETQMEARGDGLMRRAGTVRRGGAVAAQQAGDGAAGDGTSILARMGVCRRTTSDVVTVLIFTSIC